MSITVGAARFEVSRTPDGVAVVEAPDEAGLMAGLGYVHARDRFLQMALVRLASQGRLGECLKADAQTLAVDTFMRRLGLDTGLEADLARLGPAAREQAESYARGVNAWLERHGGPWELRLAGYRPEPWTVADSLRTILVMSYAGLAQSQQELELFLIESLRAGVARDALQQLFAPHLDGLDPALVDVLRQVKVETPVVPDLAAFVPVLRGSNNMAVAAHRSATGAALQANDPHLDVNRLPAVWYEAILRLPLGTAAPAWRLGITMPGVPGVVMGRTRDVSFGFTYGFMDVVDYFVEHVQGGRYRRGDAWLPLPSRTETIARKGDSPVVLTIRETDAGVIEDGNGPAIADGYWLARAWSGRLAGAAASLDAFVRLTHAQTVDEAADAVAAVTIPANWLLADRAGRIAYQQSGPLPLRRHSGLYPVAAWETPNVWRGLHGPNVLKRVVDPPGGVLVTANDDHNRDGGPVSITAHMGPDRRDRLAELLAAKPKLEVADLLQAQLDVLSRPAVAYLEILRPLLPDTVLGRRLRLWDGRYAPSSREAGLFERVWQALLREVFGRGVFGLAAWDHLAAETSLLADYFHVFDRALLGGDPRWFGSEGRDALFRRVAAEALGAAPWTRWEELNAVTLQNLFFAGRLPRFLGFDHGPIGLPGCRSTPCQGSVFRTHGRTATFAPSWRYATDLGTDEAWTSLPGGPSDRRFSRWYTSGLPAWQAGGTKLLRS